MNEPTSSSPPAKRATIREVADRAGVATMTVSRVLNQSGYASDAVRERVLAAVEELGYTPNLVARGLRSNRTGTIALLITDITNPYFTTVARGVEDAASDANQLVLFCNSDESEAEELRYMRILVEKRVDGVLFVPARGGLAALELARRNGVPVVVLDRRVSVPDVDVVRCDPVSGPQELGRMLYELGHRKFAILSGPIGTSTSDDRIVAFQAAVGDAETVVLHGEFHPKSGRLLTAEALRMSPRPTAIFATNNFLSISALQELHEQGVRVPDDIALVGFDDLPNWMVTFPFLTVVSQPAYQMGVKGVARLLERLQSTQPMEPSEEILPTEVVIRGSSGGPIQSADSE